MNEKLIAQAQQFYKLMHLQAENLGKKADLSKHAQSLRDMLAPSLAGKITVDKTTQDIECDGLVSLLITLHTELIWVRNNRPPEYSVKDNTVAIMSDTIHDRLDDNGKGLTLGHTRLRVKADIRLTFDEQLKIYDFEYEYSRVPFEQKAKEHNLKNTTLLAFTMGTSCARFQSGPVVNVLLKRRHTQ